MPVTITSVNVGTVANDGNGTNLRDAMGIINTNFTNCETAIETAETDITALETGKADTSVTAGLQSQIDSLAAGGAYPEVTYAALIAISSPANGTVRLVTDIGSPTLFRYNTATTRWVPVNGEVVLSQSGAAVAHTGTTTETSLATIAIPDGILGLSGEIEIYTLWTIPSNANNKTVRTRLGGTGINGTLFTNSVFTSSVLAISHRAFIKNQNSASVQVGYVGVAGGINAAPNTGAINTAVAQNLYINATCGNASDTITLQSYRVTLKISS